MHIQLIAKARAGHTGTSRYADDLRRGLQGDGIEVTLTSPSLPPLLRPFTGLGRRIGLDLEAFFASYPLYVTLDEGSTPFILTQTMATLAISQRLPRPFVAAVLDIIPYLLRADPDLNTLLHPIDRFFYLRAMDGLRRADHLIAISAYTRRSVLDHLGVNPEKISVVYPGVDQARFRPMSVDTAFRERYGLPEGNPYLLVVGSEDPRKNLKTLLRALARVKQQLPTVQLLKVGRAQFAQERERLLALIEELGLQGQVRFFDHVPDDDLTLFYNAADLTIMPSMYEGFGYPLVESMACGTGVLAADATSLPELVEDSARRFPALDVEACAESILRALLEDVRPAGYWLACAARFSLEESFLNTRRVFEALSASRPVSTRRLKRGQAHYAAR